MRYFSRRRFGQGLGATGLASLSGRFARASSAQPDYYKFPEGFRWGCATASYQIEGGVHEDGRGRSIWDTFSHTPGKIVNGDTGDIADDDYHLYKQDIGLLKALGATTYRFSIAWPRVFPQGTGEPNARGLAFYDRVIDELLVKGIEPYCTLFHWDLPQAMQDRFGGWESRETSKAFANYAGYVAGKLSDRVHHFFTMNEFSSFIDDGYGTGASAPGLKLPPLQLNQAKHNAVLAHGMAVRAIRAAARPGTKVGLAENAQAAVPVIESEPHVTASAKAMRELNAPYLTVILEGKYPDSYLAAAGANAPKYPAEDLQIIGTPLDFLGINVYTPTYVRADDSPPGFAVVENPTSYPTMASKWLTIGPQALYWAPRHVAEIWKVKDIYITENGASSDDRIAPDGHIYDTDRVMYLRNYLIALQRAVSEGFPVHGYFLWSLMDNFEWASGYTKRFGIYYVDYETQKRIPKLSASFYRDVIARNAVV